MKKLIAKTITGKEFAHSKTHAFFASGEHAQVIANVFNKQNYNLSQGEHWHVYDHDITQDYYVRQRIAVSKGKVKVTAITPRSI